MSQLALSSAVAGQQAGSPKATGQTGFCTRGIGLCSSTVISQNVSMFFLGVGQFWLQFPLSVELSQIRIPSSTGGLDLGALPEQNPVENAEQP